MVAAGAAVCCTFGTAPGNLNVTSQTAVTVEGKPIATIQDTAISTFGMCSSMANPQVASATAAALGVLTPQPCSMAPAGLWSAAAPTLFVNAKPALTSNASLLCATGAGNISIRMAGQKKVIV